MRLTVRPLAYVGGSVRTLAQAQAAPTDAFASLLVSCVLASCATLFWAIALPADADEHGAPALRSPAEVCEHFRVAAARRPATWRVLDSIAKGRERELARARGTMGVETPSKLETLIRTAQRIGLIGGPHQLRGNRAGSVLFGRSLCMVLGATTQHGERVIVARVPLYLSLCSLPRFSDAFVTLPRLRLVRCAVGWLAAWRPDLGRGIALDPPLDVARLGSFTVADEALLTATMPRRILSFRRKPAPKLCIARSLTSQASVASSHDRFARWPCNATSRGPA